MRAQRGPESIPTNAGITVFDPPKREPENHTQGNEEDEWEKTEPAAEKRADTAKSTLRPPIRHTQGERPITDRARGRVSEHRQSSGVSNVSNTANDAAAQFQEELAKLAAADAAFTHPNTTGGMC